MTYIKDKFTGDTLHVTIQDGFYPVRVNRDSDLKILQYSKLAGVFFENWDDGEYLKECDIFCIGDRIEMN